MSEPEKEPESSASVELKEPASPKNQIVALLTLLPVLGVLWLTMQYLPKLGDWMGRKADSVVSSVSGEDAAEKAAVETVAVAEPREVTEAPVVSVAVDTTERKIGPSPAVRAGFEDQIIEQLGGAEKVEVRHLAISDDGERMVAALKLKNEAEGGALIEVFFERDDFGRFLSSEDSPVPDTLTLWAE